jgi:hypothetical protein
MRTLESWDTEHIDGLLALFPRQVYFASCEAFIRSGSESLGKWTRRSGKAEMHASDVDLITDPIPTENMQIIKIYLQYASGYTVTINLLERKITQKAEEGIAIAPLQAIRDAGFEVAEYVIES